MQELYQEEKIRGVKNSYEKKEFHVLVKELKLFDHEFDKHIAS